MRQKLLDPQEESENETHHNDEQKMLKNKFEISLNFEYLHKIKCKLLFHFGTNCANYRFGRLNHLLASLFVNFYTKFFISFNILMIDSIVECVHRVHHCFRCCFLQPLQMCISLAYFMLIHLFFVLIHVAIVAVKKTAPRTKHLIRVYFQPSANNKHIRSGSWYIDCTKDLITTLVHSHLLAQCRLLLTTHTKNRF